MGHQGRSLPFVLSFLFLAFPATGYGDEVDGVIVDGAGKPVHRAWVHLSGWRQPKDPHDAPGRVEIDRAHPFHTNSFSLAAPDDEGDLMLMVTHPDYAPVLRRFKTAAELRRRSPLRIVMKAGVTARGVVCEPDGRPVEGACVVMQQRSAVTDASGRFALHHLAKGKDMLVVEDIPEHKHESAMIRITGDMPELRVEVEPLVPATPRPGVELFDLRGGILCSDGRPPRRAQVRVWYSGGRYTYTGPDGQFTIRGLEAKAYTLEVYPWVKIDGQDANPWDGLLVRNVGPGASGLEIRLPDFGRVKARVVEEATGKPVEAFGVVPVGPVFAEEDEPMGPGPRPRRELKGGAVLEWSPSFPDVPPVSAHPGGQLLASHVLPGRYDDLAVIADGFIQRRLSPVVVKERETVDLGTIALQRGLVVKGRIVDPSGKPVEKAELHAVGAKAGIPPPVRSEVHHPLTHWARTDQKGQFAFTGVQTLDSWRLTIDAPGYWPVVRTFRGVRGSTDIGAVAMPEESRIPLVTVSGTVRDERGKPAPAVRLHFQGRTIQEPRRWFSDLVYSDLQGRYTVRLAADSEYTATLDREVTTALGRFSRRWGKGAVKVGQGDASKDFSITLREWQGFEE